MLITRLFWTVIASIAIIAIIAVIPNKVISAPWKTTRTFDGLSVNGINDVNNGINGNNGTQPSQNAVL